MRNVISFYTRETQWRLWFIFPTFCLKDVKK